MQASIIPTETPNTVVGWFVAIAIGLASAGLAIQKLLKGWAEDRVQRMANDLVAGRLLQAQADNERLHKHNIELVNYFQEAQLKIVKISGENQRLQSEIDELRASLASFIRQHTPKEE